MQGSIQHTSREEQMVQDALATLRVLGDTFVSDYSDIENRLTTDLYVFNRDSSVADKPLTGEQLRTADGACPRHHVELEIAEYGNPDVDMVCPKCEVEPQEVR